MHYIERLYPDLKNLPVFVMLEDLSCLFNNSEVKREVDDFISESYTDLSTASSDIFVELANSHFADFADLLNDLRINYNIEPYNYLVYLSLDMKLYPLFLKAGITPVSDYFYVKGDSDFNFIDANCIEEIYNSKNAELAKYLEINYKFLPSSSSIFIHKKLNSLPFDCKDIKLSNDFEYKAFLNQLPNEYNEYEVFWFYRYFNNSDISSKFIFMIYFYKALGEKYTHDNIINLSTLKAKCLNGIFKDFETIYRKFRTVNEHIDSLRNFYRLILKDNELLNTFINEVSVKKKESGIVYLLISACSDVNMLKILDDCLMFKVQKRCKLAGVDLEQSSIEFQKSFLDEHKRQYFLKHSFDALK